jgi:hypothetical protein
VHAIEESASKKKTLAEAVKQGIARRMVGQLTSGRPGHGNHVDARVRGVIRRLIRQGKVQSESSSQPGTPAQAVRQILQQLAEK